MHHDRPGLDLMEQVTVLTPHDVYLFNEGTHFRLFDKLGARRRTQAVQLAKQARLIP